MPAAARVSPASTAATWAAASPGSSAEASTMPTHVPARRCHADGSRFPARCRWTPAEPKASADPSSSLTTATTKRPSVVSPSARPASAAPSGEPVRRSSHSAARRCSSARTRSVSTRW